VCFFTIVPNRKATEYWVPPPSRGMTRIVGEATSVNACAQLQAN
jgi:hypothetical protein